MSSYPERCASHPYVDAIWHKMVPEAAYWVSADGCWDIIFAKEPEGTTWVFISGPMTRARLVRHMAGTKLLGIRFKASVYMPGLLPGAMIDQHMSLDGDLTCSSLWLEVVQYYVPCYENAESFVEKLCRNNVLVRDAVVDNSLQGRPTMLSPRSVQRHFALTSGVTRNFLEQVKRVQLASRLLNDGVAAVRVATLAGYADQAHMTHSFKLLFGRTPSQLVQTQLA